MSNLIKILIAEDNKTLSLFMKNKLEKEGYQLLIAEDGNQAKKMILEGKPDLLITDIMMPYISGLELISYVRNELKSKIPVIVFSSVGHEKMILQAFELGANEFMTKPFSPNELVIRVKKCLLNYVPL